MEQFSPYTAHAHLPGEPVPGALQPEDRAGEHRLQDEVPQREPLPANARIAVLTQEVRRAEARLKDALNDLETREQSSAFQTARDLFEQGIRLYARHDWEVTSLWLMPVEALRRHSGEDLREREEQYRYGARLSEDGQGVEEAENRLYDQLGLAEDENGRTVLRYLLDLTEESPEAHGLD